MESNRYLILWFAAFAFYHGFYVTDGRRVKRDQEEILSSGCPRGWASLGEKCYGFYLSQVPWWGAKEECSEMGATLLSIHSQEEQDFVREMIMDREATDTWIGLHEEGSHSRYRRLFTWSDDSELDFTAWNEREPNDPTEQCVHMWFREEKHGKWNDVPCSLVMAYICQVLKGSTLSERPKFISESTTETVTIGDSVTFSCDTENTENFTLSWRKRDQIIFTGQQRNTEDERFQTVNETSLHIMTVQPPDSGEYSCVISTDPPMHLPHTLRVTSHPSPAGPPCPNKSEKWIDLGGDNCYLIETENEVMWTDAVYNCYVEGGSLVIFHSSEEVKRIVRYLKHQEGRLHIGLYKHNDGSLEWIDKSEVDYRNWNAGEPNDIEEQCTEIYTENGEWNDIVCDRKLGYICSSPKEISRETPISSTKVCPDTSSKWENLSRDFCYIIEVDGKIPWNNASQRCSEAGGSLASFHSIQEVAMVLQYTKGYYDKMHIGLRRNGDGQFKWSDKSPLDMNYWRFGEPDGRYEPCGQMSPYNGQWRDISCDRVAGYICSVEKVDAGVPQPGPTLPSNVTCGGEMTADSGNIESSNYPDDYGPNENCLWKITVPQHYQVALNFHIIEMEYGAECEYDYVEVIDEQRSIKLCGSAQPQTILSSRNEISVKFVSDASREDIGFLSEFTKMEQCGGNIVSEEGLLQSRNYPDNYLPNDICVWKITVPEKFKVLLKFQAFEIEYTDSCSADYLEVTDGHDSSSPILGRFCGSQIPSDIISSGHKITVIFSSDYAKEYYGFSAEFKKTAVTPTVAPATEPSDNSDNECGGDIVEESGFILSPNYPSHYSASQRCTWRITVPDGYQVLLYFKTFELESERWCNYDYVEVLDGHGADSQQLGKFCGSRVPQQTISSGNEITLQFKSDSSGQYRGFAAVFKKWYTDDRPPEITTSEEGELCQQDITSDEGVVQSPNYPENYGPNEKCSWKITVPQGHKISLKFTAFDVEIHDACSYDYVEIRDGHSLDSRILATLCGDEIPQDIASSRNKMMITFKSDSTSEYKGFSAEFKKVLAPVLSSNITDEEPETCGGNYSAQTGGTISSPNYPGSYPGQTICIWNIAASEDQQVVLIIDALNLEYGDSCQFDYLEVFDGPETQSTILRKLCGSKSDEIIRSTGNSMTVKFVTDQSIETSGFTAHFKTVGTCGGNIVAEEGVIQTPNYPDNYGPGERCFWTLTVPENYTLSLKFLSFDVACEDGVMVRDTHDILGRFCGTDLPPTIFASSNEIEINFESHTSGERKGFSAEFRKVERCGADIIAEEGVIQSPNYPDDYELGQRCIWTITVPEDYKVELNFLSFDVDCNGDEVKVTDNRRNSYGTFCGSDIPSSVRSNSNQLQVEFISDSSISGKGFSAEFRKDVCGGDISGGSGTISSENYPKKYPSSSRCIWKITAPENHQVVLEFQSFDVERCTECNCDYVEIRDGHEFDSPRLGKFCGSSTPAVIKSSTENMTVKFQADRSVQYKGFRANFRTEFSPESELTNLLRQFPSLITKTKEANPELQNEAEMKKRDTLTRYIRSIFKK